MVEKTSSPSALARPGHGKSSCLSMSPARYLPLSAPMTALSGPEPQLDSARYQPDSPRWRNARGLELEADGQLDEAIELYERNVADGYVGALPYDRLRIIYARRQELASAIRVCRAAIRALGADPGKARRFEGALMRLQGRTSRQMLDHGIHVDSRI